jgi:GNAT superfamily N-acetyltransferase
MTSTHLRIRRLTPADLPFADTVRAAAGWNQTLDDWRRLLRYEPEGCFLAELDGEPAGTATTTTYGNEVGWIGMVLVHPDSRRRGVATALLEKTISYLQGRVRCIKLDATPAGERVYAKLGFQAELTLSRWHCGQLSMSGLRPTAKASRLQIVQRDDWPQVDRFDAAIFGTTRGEWLKQLAGDSLETLIAKDQAGGTQAYGMARAGMLASYLGPVVSFRSELAAAMIVRLLAGVGSRPVFWDILDDCTPAVALAQELGFERQRHLLRMYLGRSNVTGEPARQWAIGGFATG